MHMLDGKVAIITGSGRGIGAATARLLGSEGARIILSELDTTHAVETAAGILAACGQAAVVPGVFSDYDFT
jgi:3-oxoacyl-[acyl-carrier protein] reductase